MFKGIFIDESESFDKRDVEFIQEFLYETKYIFNMYYCESLNIYNSVNIFKTSLEYIDLMKKYYLQKIIDRKK